MCFCENGSYQSAVDSQPWSFLFEARSKNLTFFSIDTFWHVSLRNMAYIGMKHPVYTLKSGSLLSPGTINELSKIWAQFFPNWKTSFLVCHGSTGHTKARGTKIPNLNLQSSVLSSDIRDFMDLYAYSLTLYDFCPSWQWARSKIYLQVFQSFEKGSFE